MDARLTILQLLESDGPGGAETVVLQLSEELRNRGHRVVFVGPERGVGWLGARIREAGVPQATFRLDRPIDPGCVARLAALARGERADVMHSHEFTMAVYGAFAARRAGARHVITMHGNQTMTRALRRRLALRAAFSLSDASVAVSHATKAQLDRDLGLAPGRLGVVLNGVPIRPGARDATRAALGIGPEALVLLAVGNLEERKGHIILLQALAALEGEALAVPWQLVIAGGRGGPERKRLEAFIAERSWGQRVRILTQRSDVPDLLAAADIFTMPSLWEGLPLAMLEAMLAARPIVASETSGIPEAIVHDRDGLLVPPGDVAALATALRALLLDASLRQRLGAAALSRARGEFTIGAMADRYERLYRAG